MVAVQQVLTKYPLQVHDRESQAEVEEASICEELLLPRCGHEVMVPLRLRNVI